MPTRLVGWSLLSVLMAHVLAYAQDVTVKKDVEDLSRILKTVKDPHQRVKALTELSNLAQIRTGFVKPAIPSVAEALTDEDAAIRQAAAKALQFMAPEPKLVLASLVALLDAKEDRPTRVAAATTLSVIGRGAAAALPSLEAALAREKSQAKPDVELVALLEKTAATARAATLGFGEWHYVGPFPNDNGSGFKTEFPPEKQVDLNANYSGKGELTIGWKRGNFNDGEVVSFFGVFGTSYVNSACYLYREIEVARPMEVAVSFGSDDTLTVWCNGDKLISQDVRRAAAPDQDKAVLKLKAGKNQLLIKVCQGNGDWAYYFRVVEAK